MTALVKNLGETATAARRIVHRTRGRSHGPITRLMSPSDLGHLMKPFVFLDHFKTGGGSGRKFGFGWHPHSGIATVSVILDGAVTYAETTGVSGVLEAGGVEWMRAGGGVWHTGGPHGDAPIHGYQLWVALPASLELAEPQSRYLAAADVPAVGPARIILGAYEGAASPVPSPVGMTYMTVRLAPGERWRFVPPMGHEVAFVAVHQGQLETPEPIEAETMAVFDHGNAPIDFEAGDTGAAFILGSAVRHPHDLVLGNYSVHTSPTALEQGEANIRRLGTDYHRRGLIQLG